MYNVATENVTTQLNLCSGNMANETQIPPLIASGINITFNIHFVDSLLFIDD